MARVRILVVDDDREIVRLVRSYLEQDGFQVTFAFDGETALRVLRHERPHLVVLDLMLPDRDGVEITRMIRDDVTLQDTAIIMLTARVEDTDKISGLELGADDYITKPFNPGEVVARVRSVLRRSVGNTKPAGNSLIESGTIALDAYRREVSVSNTPIELTPTEFELLHTLMQHAGYAFTRSELIERSLGYDHDSLDRSLDSHIKNLRKKLEPDPRNPTYIQTVYGVGYRFATENDLSFS